MKVQQLLGHIGPFLQTSVGFLQTLDFPVARVSSLATGLAGRQAGFTVLGQFSTPVRQLTGIQTVTPQPGTLVAVAQPFAFGQQTLLFRYAEPA